MNEKEVRRYLTVIKRAVSLIEDMLEHDDDGLLEQMVLQEDRPVRRVVAPQFVYDDPPEEIVHVERVPEVAPVVTPQVRPEELAALQAARKKHIDDLMAIDCWPEALPAFLTVKEPSAEDQVNRAKAVLDMMIGKPMENMRFLDFGCGDGWIAQEAFIGRGVTESTGYDIKSSDNWEHLKGATFTNSYDSLNKHHYDMVMLYDVLDHCEDPLDVMTKVKDLLKRDGVAYVRCHPWTSRHASHIHKQGINKAYMHLFLKYEELLDMIGEPPMFTRVEKNPLEAYQWWFNGFDIDRERFVKEPVSEFFFVPAFKELLATEQQISAEEVDSLLDRMQIQFVDYVLSPKKQ